MRPIAALNTSWVAPLLLAGCAGLGPQQQTCAPFDIAGQVGTTWVRSTTDTGSYGSGTSQASNTRLPKSIWRGQEVYRVNTTNNTGLLQRPDGAFIATVNGDALVLTWDPPAGYEWPLYVGKSWVRKTNITNHARNETRAVEERLTVEAMEDVTVPAGKFRACRIRSVDNLGGNDNTNWLSPEIGIFVKQRLTRTAQHASGAGTRETELISHNIKRAGY